MTRRRRSFQSVERRLAELETRETPRTVAEWVGTYVGSGGDEFAAEYTVYNGDGEIVEKPDHAEEVCIMQSKSPVVEGWYAPAADVPEWIDADEDLPVSSQ